MKSFRKTGKQAGPQKCLRIVAAASVVCIAVTLGLTALLGLGIDRGFVRMELIGAGAYLVVALSALAGIGVCALWGKNGKLISALLTGAVYYLCLVVGRLLLGLKGSARLLPTAGIVLLVSLLCGVLGARERRRAY